MTTQKRNERLLWISALLLLPLLAACDSSGTVQGNLQFFQNQGNFCPAGRDCTGAKYTAAQFNTNQPIANVKVYIRRHSDNLVLGQGTTNNMGNFTMQWTLPEGNRRDVEAHLIIRYEHQNDRFTVNTEGGGFWISSSGSFVVEHNTVQNLGGFTAGNAASPPAIANVYDGAVKMWNNSLAQSALMAAVFSGVSIRAFDNAGTCPTSCAQGANNRILMDPNSTFMPQARVMHEMGHIASYVASRNQEYTFGGDYCWPATGNCGWNLNTAEWGAAQFEEGVATHLGDVGLYFPGATQPHTCISTNSCPNNTFNIETSLGNSCTANQARQPIQSIRYHWDNYDSLDDFAGAASDTLNQGMWNVVDTINDLNNGIFDNQKNEPWGPFLLALDDRDGRSNIDFRQAWNTAGTNSATQLTQNCGGIGD